jgi:cysteinyl-tRNA synthetase
LLKISFFENIESRNRNKEIYNTTSKRLVFWEEPEYELSKELSNRKYAVYKYLQNDMNTPKALMELLGIVSASQSYMASRGADCRAELLQSCDIYVRDMLGVFGVQFANSRDPVKISTDNKSEEHESALVDSILDFRSRIRATCLSAADHATLKGSVLKLCDGIRNDVLPKIGYHVQDQAGGKYVWKRKV